jgi:aminoglycoside phosphotransferase (APT) family kinase protein
LATLPGELVARGTRSSVRAYGDGAVVKVPDVATADVWIRFEAAYAEAARNAGAPVPRLLGVESIGGRAASVWERVEGQSMWQHAVDRPERSGELGRLLADVHRSLFDLVPPVTLPRQRDRLASKIRRSAATIEPSFAQALELMPEAASAPRLCHGDLHPSNVIMSPDGPMVVDWFDASRGDPLADIARSLLVLRGDGLHPPRHLPGAGPGTLATLTDAYLARLGEHLAIDRTLLLRWQAVNAVARMAEGVERGDLVEVWTKFSAGGRAYAAAN